MKNGNHEHQVYNIVDLPEGKKVIGCRWIFEIKLSEERKISK